MLKHLPVCETTVELYKTKSVLLKDVQDIKMKKQKTKKKNGRTFTLLISLIDFL